MRGNFFLAKSHVIPYNRNTWLHFKDGGIRVSKNLISRIIELKASLPKKQQLLCNYIVLNHEQIAVMTVAELASNAGTGTTTVLRLVQALGYDSYITFRRDLANASLMQNSTPYRGLKDSISTVTDGDGSNSLSLVAGDGIRVLESLISEKNLEQFNRAMELLLRAQSIYTIGVRSSRAIAEYFSNSVSCFYPHIHALHNSLDYIFDRVELYMTPSDVLVAFSVWPCTKTTIRVCELCHKKGIPVILITNTSLNPALPFSDVVFDTNSANHASGDVALIAVVEAMVSELGHRAAPESTRNIERVEKTLNENEIILWEARPFDN